MYANDIAAVYDLVHEGKGKDYRSEAGEIAALVRAHRPGTTSLLDVACGTGQHLRHLAGLFDRVEGLEISRDMLAIAAGRNPGIPLHEGDMRSFALTSRFDAVICMFSSIGHLRDGAELDATLARFAAHLEPGGVIVVEPWWFPDSFTPGYIGASVTEAGDRTISRVSHSVRDGDATRIEVHYLIARPGEGIRHLTEEHTITLFPRTAYERAFERAGCRVLYQEGGPSGRGLFIGTRADFSPAGA
ncbi:class I SAM-dependent DNA methyltransferase [Streptomyces albireticuli]|uniref:SAM-dependent methyltransferase n=1 Tax=Streptomyces albireticuli TaxID=1940 RepID=A0A2A2D4G0_9ACTN|nr:class I SAM-dependent methyltransferase [Streptomyces albireticuli]MCD9140522.1 class I SAM-dependent methyltransferase [Streptomyces albireticuli]MCD9161516.1 class I SAM-dependent methyltransferase [Streptomyces albireticuli]MCD9192914.1 class I SAM-dependent methyltransferase [Streptomyces albireticuli]PAU46326.1 SAM-dependent methyltransferase [Streptomyces albireticuli]